MKQLLIIILATAVMVSGCGPSDAKKPKDLADRYSYDFGTLPPADVEVKESRLMSSRDWAAQWLLLQVKSKATLDDVILKRFTKSDTKPGELAVSHHTPKWWQLPPDSELEFYKCDNWRKQTNISSTAVVAVDRARGMVYFRHDQID